MLSFGQLQTLNAISETGSFSKAARKLYLSQPAVSQRIRSLEEAVCAELFDRDSGGMHLMPTAAGAEVIKFAKATLESYDLLLRRLAEIALQESVVTVGAPSLYNASHVLPRLLPLIHAAQPTIRLRMVTMSVEGLAEAALAGTADLVFLPQSWLVAGLESCPLWEDNTIMVCHPRRATELAGHPRSVPLIISGARDDHELARRWCVGMGLSSRVVVESMSADMLKNAALANMGYALLPEAIVRNEIASGALIQITVPGLPLRRTIVAAYAPERAQSPVLANFLNALLKVRHHFEDLRPLAAPQRAFEPEAAARARPRVASASA